jgi:hypothetical protein
MFRRYGWCLLVAISVLLFFFFPVKAKANMDMLGGTVVNETKTPWGEKFVKAFNDQWSSPAFLDCYYVEITGQPTRSGTGEKVMVRAGTMLNKRAVYATFVSPRDYKLKQQAKEAVRRVINYLTRRYIQENTE